MHMAGTMSGAITATGAAATTTSAALWPTDSNPLSTAFWVIVAITAVFAVATLFSVLPKIPVGRWYARRLYPRSQPKGG